MFELTPENATWAIMGAYLTGLVLGLLLGGLEGDSKTSDKRKKG